MVIAFQIILLILMPFSVFGIIGEKDNKQMRETMMGIFLASLAAFIVSVLWL